VLNRLNSLSTGFSLDKTPKSILAGETPIELDVANVSKKIINDKIISLIFSQQ